MGCVSSSVHDAMLEHQRDKYAIVQRELELARVRIAALEDEVRKVRLMDTSQRVLHEQKLRLAAENRLVAHLREEKAAEHRRQTMFALEKARGDSGARAVGLLNQIT